MEKKKNSSMAADAVSLTDLVSGVQPSTLQASRSGASRAKKKKAPYRFNEETDHELTEEQAVDGVHVAELTAVDIYSERTEPQSVTDGPNSNERDAVIEIDGVGTEINRATGAVAWLVQPFAPLFGLGAGIASYFVTCEGGIDISAITPEQIDTFSPAQIAALGGDLSSLSAAAMGSIDATQAAQITPEQLDSFDSTDIQALVPEAVGALMPAALASLSDAQLAALTPAQVAAITPAQIDTLSPAQIAALGADLSSLSAAAMGSIDAIQAATAAAVGGFDAFTPDSLIDLSPGAISVVPLPVFKLLTPSQLAQWDSEQLSAITPQQKQVLTLSQVTELSYEQSMQIQGSYAPAGVQATTSYHIQPMTAFDNVGGYRVTEGSTITLLVTRMGDTSAAGTVDIQGTGSAASSDYALVATTVSFAAGETSKRVQLSVNPDGEIEGHETLLLSLVSPSGSAQVGAAASLTLVDAGVVSWWIGNSPNSITEGNTLRIEVVRNSGAGAGSVTLELSGTVNAADLATPLSRLVNFADGVTSVWVDLEIVRDSLAEGQELISRVVLRDPTAGVVSADSRSIAVYDVDATHWIVTGGSYSAGDSEAIFFVQRTGQAGVAAIDFRTVGGSARAGVDYQAQNLTLNFAAGQMTQVVRVPLLDNQNAQTNLSILGVIAGPTGSGSHSVQVGNSTVTLVNDQVSVWSVAGSEVREDAGLISFTVTRSGNASQAASIDFATVSGTAAAGADYSGLKQTLNFASGEVQKTVLVSVHMDALTETSETIVGIISNTSSGSVGTASATATIVDRSASVWSVSVSNVAEGEQVFMLFTVTRSSAVGAAQIDFATVGGTATGGVDYTPVSQTLNFVAGQASQVVRVAITNDGVAENNETIVGAVSKPSGGVIQTPSATGQINDNSNMIWSVQHVVGSGTVSSGVMAFEVTRDTSGDLSAAQVRFFTVAGNLATKTGSDYTPVDTLLQFAIGEYRKTVLVPINSSVQPDNTGKSVVGVIDSFSLGTLSTVASSAVSGSIINDLNASGGVPVRVFFKIGALSAIVSEDTGAAAYTITRSGDTSGSQTVEYYASGGTALAGTHFEALPNGGVGLVSFAPGETSKVVMIPLLPNASTDVGTTLTVVLRNASQGILSVDATGLSQATVTLQDNDAVSVPVYSVGATSNNVLESTGAIAFTITRSGNTSAETTSYFRLNGGTATAGTDYTDPGVVNLNWLAGETTKVVRVNLIADAVTEGNETLNAQVSASSDFSGTPVSGTLTVVEAAGTFSYAVSTVTTALARVLEDSEYILYTVQRSGDLSQASTSYFRLSGGAAGVDYETPEGANGAGVVALAWREGESRKIVRVKLLNDNLRETDENITGQSASNDTFTEGLTSAIPVLINDDWFTGTSGNDILSNSDAGAGLRIDAGDGVDTVTIASAMRAHTQILLGNGDDVLMTANGNNFLAAGGLVDGGAGVDTIRFSNTTRWGLVNSSLEIENVEIFDFNTLSNQFLDLSLQNILEITHGNAVVDTLRIMSTGTTNTVSLQALGKALSTPSVGSMLTDVDGIGYAVGASAAGNADTNDVLINGRTYDVYQYNYAGQDLTLLVDVAMTMRVI